MFLKWRGVEVDNGCFELRFNEPQNFSSFRETEMDAARIGTFTSLEQYPYLSKRYLMHRYLGMSEEEMVENSKLWREENADISVESELPSMRSVGVTAGGIQSDIDQFTPPETTDEGGDTEGEVTEEVNTDVTEVVPTGEGSIETETTDTTEGGTTEEGLAGKKPESLMTLLKLLSLQHQQLKSIFYKMVKYLLPLVQPRL